MLIGPWGLYGPALPGRDYFGEVPDGQPVLVSVKPDRLGAALAAAEGTDELSATIEAYRASEAAALLSWPMGDRGSDNSSPRRGLCCRPRRQTGADELLAASTVRLEMEGGALSWDGPDVIDGAAVIIDTTGIEPDDLRSDLIDVHLDAVAGPGETSAGWRSPFDDAHLPFGSGAGHPRDTVVQVGRRTMINWVFSAPGTYDVTLTASAPTSRWQTSASGGIRFDEVDASGSSRGRRCRRAHLSR